MKAKEKAVKLVIKYSQYFKANSFINQEENSKECALITVNELINDCDASSPFEEKRINYWQEVKKEIESL